MEIWSNVLSIAGQVIGLATAAATLATVIVRRRRYDDD